ISNPYVSDTYNFSQMYDPAIHNEQNQTGLYNYYNPNGDGDAQYVYVRNELTDIATNGTTTTNIYNSGTIPESISDELLHDITFYTYNFPPQSYSGSISDTYYNDANFLTLRPGGTGFPMWFWFVSISSFDLASPLNNDDIYLSFVMGLESGAVGTLFINGQAYGGAERTSWNYNRELINDVSTIGFTAYNDVPSGDRTYSRDAYLYYFKVERITSDNEFLQSPSVEEVENVMLDWGQYLTTPKDSDGIFGFEFTYKLPVVSRDSLDSIQVSFDASINSLSFEGGNYPLSIQLWNYAFQRWESIPLAPIDSVDDTYESDELDYDFWTWHPDGSSPPTDKFRPEWGTLGFQRINTIGYGATFPHTIDANGNIVYNNTLIAGSSFLDNDDTDHQLNNLYSNKGKVLFYDDQYNFLADEFNTNKYQLKNIVIDPSNFYTSPKVFPEYKDSEGFNKYPNDDVDFYDYFVNDLHEFKIQLVAERESTQNDNDDASLCIGSFNTYTLTTTNYLNYDDFESNAINGKHVSDKIVFTSDGIELLGYSGFNVKDTPQTVKFKDNFLASSWTLENVLEPTMDFQKLLEGDTYVRSLFPYTIIPQDGNYPLSAYQKTSDPLFRAFYIDIFTGTWKSGDPTDTFYDDEDVYSVSSFQSGTHTTSVRYDIWNVYYKTENVFYDIFVSTASDIYIYMGDASNPDWNELVASTTGSLSLSGSTIIERSHPYLWVTTSSWSAHTVDVDRLVSQGVPEEFESFFETYPISYLVQGENDIWELEADLTFNYGQDTQLFLAGDFNENTLTWNNKDTVPIYSLISFDEVNGNKISWSLGDITSERQHFKIDSPQWQGGKDFTNPIVKYSIAKKYQEGGLLYMQTDEVTGELLTLKSQVYNSSITITPNDQLVIEFQATTDNKVDLTLFSNGEIQRVYNVIPQGNTDFTSQFILLETTQTLQFDQLNFSGVLDDNEYFSVNSISVMEGASLIDTQLSESKFTEQSG
ncbi:hypothetical protein LCGC14_1713060, partial [marine sediment metagenome]